MTPAGLRAVPFVHGYVDFLAGKGFLDNPYPQDTNDFRIWIDGYVRALTSEGCTNACPSPNPPASHASLRGTVRSPEPPDRPSVEVETSSPL